MELKFAPVTKFNIDEFRLPEFTKVENSIIKVIFSRTTERCEMLGQEPSIAEFIKQFGVSLLVTNNNVGDRRLRVVRKFFRSLIDTCQKAQKSGFWIGINEVFPKGIKVPDWLDDDWDSVAKADSFLKHHTLTEIKEMAIINIKQMIEESKNYGNFGTEPEIVFELIGTSKSGGAGDHRRPPQKRWEPIGEKELEQLLEQIKITRTDVTGIHNYPYMTGLLVTTTWLTGLRFIEVFNFKLMRPKPNVNLKTVLLSPLQAYKNRQLEPYSPTEVTNSAMCSDSCAYIPLMIAKTAKSKLASPSIENSQRVLILQGIPSHFLAILQATEACCNVKLPTDKIDNLRLSYSKILTKASKKAFPYRRDTVTFHSMRHAFADRVKLQYDEASAAVLLGHSALKSLRGYGKKRRSQSKGITNQWLPQPDLACASHIRTVWKVNKQPRPLNVIKYSPNPDYASG